MPPPSGYPGVGHPGYGYARMPEPELRDPQMDSYARALAAVAAFGAILFLLITIGRSHTGGHDDRAAVIRVVMALVATLVIRFIYCRAKHREDALNLPPTWQAFSAIACCGVALFGVTLNGGKREFFAAAENCQSNSADPFDTATGFTFSPLDTQEQAVFASMMPEDLETVMEPRSVFSGTTPVGAAIVIAIGGEHGTEFEDGFLHGSP